MQKRKIKRLDQSATNEQERAQTTVKAGRKSYSKKYEKASKPSRRRQQNERANAGKKRQNDIPHPAFKLADLLPDETIKKLRGIK